jgi:hypothetical protein
LSGVVARAVLALTLLVLGLLLGLGLVPSSAGAACRSRAVGLPQHGRLVCGVQLPGETDAVHVLQ